MISNQHRCSCLSMRKDNWTFWWISLPSTVVFPPAVLLAEPALFLYCLTDPVFCSSPLNLLPASHLDQHSWLSVLPLTFYLGRYSMVGSEVCVNFCFIISHTWHDTNLSTAKDFVQCMCCFLIRFTQVRHLKGLLHCCFSKHFQCVISWVNTVAQTLHYSQQITSIVGWQNRDSKRILKVVEDMKMETTFGDISTALQFCNQFGW